jgi:hypothetical protein
MILRPALLVILIFCSISTYCQSLFEFDYHFDIDNKREPYNAFMLRNDDGTGFMRVRFREDDTQPWILVQMEIQEHYMGDEDLQDATSTDSTILVFEGFNPELISGPAGMAYDMIRIYLFSDTAKKLIPTNLCR